MHHTSTSVHLAQGLAGLRNEFEIGRIAVYYVRSTGLRWRRLYPPSVVGGETAGVSETRR
ncbi:hypothetical protein CBI38_32290 (plasmid) [Rhodococcus oxybenzonivorans]|uniref:Uncharacterized protein n=1 Tax=Rhodococcus oxybenzonivorans TaxID=1990687 RepID=A0A2S2C5M3_9NOCA|nr:hypothetical protein CBI38_32290 [Rhodococcus oxybenzonivorans]